MTGPAVADTILKVLNGVQAGIEVSLLDGDYSLGSGNDDDIQLIDVALKSGHARVRVAGGKIELAGASGTLTSGNGLAIPASSEWQAVEPLDIITAGTVKFALGLPTANWASIAEGDAREPAEVETPATPAANMASTVLKARRGLVMPTLLGVMIAVVLVWYLFTSISASVATPQPNLISAIERAKEAVARFPFGAALDIRQEVDGQIYVVGYVKNATERRAIQGAIEEAKIPARVRIRVLENIKSEVANLLEAEQQRVSFNLTEDGKLALTGLILDEKKKDSLVALLKDRVVGLASIESRIRTAATLLVDVRELAKLSRIESFVLFRLDGDLIEATGAIPAEKVDAWVGFLQAYARRFSQLIVLRSFVQLQDINAPAPTVESTAAKQGAIIVGEAEMPGDGPRLDTDRLREGGYKLNDVFVAPQAAPAASDVVGTAKLPTGIDQTPQKKPTPKGLVRRVDRSTPHAWTTSARSPRKTGDDDKTRNVPAATKPTISDPSAFKQPSTPPAQDAHPAPQLNIMADELVKQWQDGRLEGKDDAVDMKEALAKLEANDRPAPLFASLRDHEGNVTAPCWAGSLLTPENLAGALFWLDLLSVNEKMTMASFDVDLQIILLETALNPNGALACADRLAKGALPTRSLYLDEVGRNSDFVRFITRDLRTYPLDVSGAHVGNIRYVQTRSGLKMFEGAAPDAQSRIVFVGELGVAIQQEKNLAVVVFGSDLNWLMR